ncbi:MAG TPA: NB-ARC domain-containing protein [Caldilineaceae bacterium]|nr:NB-ARC domain-containing protein [Caldilineaceae bacterium]
MTPSGAKFTSVDQLAQQLKQTLRSLQTPEKLTSAPLLQSDLIVKAKRSGTVTPTQILHGQLDSLCDELAQQQPLLADLLKGRFWEGLPVEAMVQADRPEPQSISRFYQKQEQAIQMLAQLWQEAEHKSARDELTIQLMEHLPSPSYTTLVGVEAVVDRVIDHLLQPEGPAIVTIKGVGGIGKTAIADCVVRTLMAQSHDAKPVTFQEIIWISAKQEALTLSSIVSYRNGSSDQIALEQIFDELGDKLGLAGTQGLSLAQWMARLAVPLRRKPHLIVIDNLETVADFQELVPWLSQLSQPTRFLLTSRNTVPSLARVATVEMDELSAQSALRLIHATAQQKGVTDCNEDAIYELVGGNPLAIILIVSLMRRLPPAQVLASVRSGELENLYKYIYLQSWQTLQTSAQKLLFAIQRAGDVAEWDWLELVHDSTTASLCDALIELLDLSLVYCHSEQRGVRRYAIHRLTSTFLHAEVLGWK